MSAGLLGSVVAHAALVAAAAVAVSGSGASDGPEAIEVEVAAAPPASTVAEPSAPAQVAAAAPPASAPAPRKVIAPRRAVAAAVSTVSSFSAPADAPHDDGLDQAPPRFAMVAATVASQAPQASQVSSGAASGGVAGAANGTEPLAEREVSEPARLLRSSPLVYPPAARQAEIEADLPVEIVVGIDGAVTAARAVTRAGYGLEEAALQAIRAYRFSPAVRDGRPVRVRMRWTVQFRLR